VVTTPEAPVFVDTNILVYAHGVGDEDVRGPQARTVLSRLWRAGTGVLSTQVLQEFYAVATRKLKPPLSPKQAREIVVAYTDWCTVNSDPALIVSASRLAEKHTIAFRDALVIEGALQAGAAKLLSEDLQHGRSFDSLVIANPFLNDAPGS
jgi:predicted nucleic acid-binding protein